MEHLPLRSGLDDDGTELIGSRQASLCRKRKLKLPVRRRRRRTYRSGRNRHILRFDSFHDIVGSESAHAHLLRIQPYPHAVLSCSERLHLTHAVDPRQLVDQIKFGIIGEIKSVVVMIVGRIIEQTDKQYDVSGARHHRHTLLLHRRGESRLGYGHAVLHLNCGHIQIGSRLKSHREHIRPVGTGAGT